MAKLKTTIDWQPREDATYIDKTKRTATVFKIPLLLVLIAIIQFVLLTWSMGFWATFSLFIVEVYLYRKLRKMNIPVTRLPFYLSERKSNVRRALPRRYQDQFKVQKKARRRIL